MSRSVIFANTFRFIALVLLQVLILKRINLGGDNFNYISILVYPLFILLLPLRTPRAAILLLAFVLGISVDIFYDSLGVHASAAVFMAYIRAFILAQLEPRGGYNPNYSPTKKRLGFAWFFRYAGFLMFFHLLFYFSVETFNFSQFTNVLLKTATSFVASMLIIVMLMFLFDPTD